MEILSHLNLMVKQRPALVLPTEALLEQFGSSVVPGPVKNFTQIYLRNAWTRLDRKRQVRRLAGAPPFLPFLSSASKTPTLPFVCGASSGTCCRCRGHRKVLVARAHTVCSTMAIFTYQVC